MDKFKCYSCGKVFKDNAHLLKHKNRKTPCLIREITPENLQNPNRCIFCNKVFSKKENLTKHLKTCKIKNGGMNILDEKVRYEQEIRIVKEQHLREINELRDEIKEIRQQMKTLTITNNTTTNNIGAINNTTNNIGAINITFNNYDTPATDTLNLTQDDLLVKNIAQKIIEMIYFNKDLPQNHTIYLPNIKEKRLLVHKNNAWEHIGSESIPDTFISVKNAAQLAGYEKINQMCATDEEFKNLYPVVQESIKSFNFGSDHAKCSDDEIMEIVKRKRELIAQTLRQEKIL